MSSKCTTIMCEDSVIKCYNDDCSFKMEKECYKRLEGKKFIPQIIQICDENRQITMERIKFDTLLEYYNKNSKIPYGFARDMKNILIEMVEVGILRTPDIWKNDHIFITENEQIKIIDFDVISLIKMNDSCYKERILRRKEEIEEEYAFLKGDEDSKKRFRERLQRSFCKDAVDDFFKNMKN